MYKSNYKKGSYGTASKGFKAPRQLASVRDAQQRRYAAQVLHARGGAPSSNRGFGSMAVVQNRERKFFDTAYSSYNMSTTGLVVPIFIPILGSDYNNRIGRKTILKSLYIRGRIAIENAVNLAVTNTPAQQVRMIVLLDQQPNGATAGITDILNTAEPSSQLNANNRDRFKIIKDKTLVFDPLIINTTATQSFAIANRTMQEIKIYKKLNCEVIFNGTNAGTIGDINSGALLIAFVGSNATGTNTDADFFGTFRCRFDDS